jgi:hypothetical protein
MPKGFWDNRDGFARSGPVNVFVMASVAVPAILLFLCGAASLLLAKRKNDQLFERAPELLPYTWGYFLGYSGIIVGILVGVTAGVLTRAGLYRDWFPPVLAYVLLIGIASYGVLTRRRWGWLFHIPLSLNPGLWAFNSVYVSNRWREF